MYLSNCFVYAGRESEYSGQVLAGLQEAAQKPNQIKRIYSLTDEAGFHQRYINGHDGKGEAREMREVVSTMTAAEKLNAAIR